MKLGVTYIVFDGIELIEHSIKQIRSHADHVIVIYQNSSWFGVPFSNQDLVTLKRLQGMGLINELVAFTDFVPIRDKTPQGIMRAKSYEREKRQLGLNLCLKRGCTHYLCMDVDEFYQSEQFAKAKAEIIEKGYTQTSVRFINYVNIPTVHRGYDTNRVPFICKIDSSTKMTPSFFTKCDPTRGITGSGKAKHEFNPNVITMHHMETVRKNLDLKYSSTTRAIFNRGKTDELIKSIKSVKESNQSINFNKIIYPALNSVKLTQCENIFKIPYQEW
jgi:hypothetical protein